MPEPERPLSPARTFVRPAPAAPYGLASMAFAVSFRIRYAEAKTAVKHHRPKRTDGRFSVGDNITVVPRAKCVSFDVIYWMVNSSSRILSGPSELPLSLRLIIYKDTLYFCFFGILVFLLNV